MGICPRAFAPCGHLLTSTGYACRNEDGAQSGPPLGQPQPDPQGPELHTTLLQLGKLVGSPVGNGQQHEL